MKFLPAIAICFALSGTAFAQDGAHTHAQLEASITAIEVEAAAGKVEDASIREAIDRIYIDFAVILNQHALEAGAADEAMQERLDALEALHAEPIPEPDPVPDPPPPEPEPEPDPSDWVARTLANCTTVWCRSDLVEWNKRPAWTLNSFTDKLGTYTRSTRGDQTSDPVRTTGPTINLVEYQSAIFNVWCSFPKLGNLIYFYCGGHGGYAGGDIYQWNIETDTFELIFEPRRLKFFGVHPDGYEMWRPADGSPTAPHTYGVALWHSSGKILWQRGGASYGYVHQDSTWHSFRSSDPDHRSDLKIFDARNLTAGRGDPSRWSWGPDIHNWASAAPSAVELPDGSVLFIDDQLRLSFYDVASNTMGPKTKAAGISGRVGAAHAVYSAFDDKVYVRISGGIARIDYKNFTSERLAVPAQLPESNTTSGNYRGLWYDRSGLVAAGSKLAVIGGVRRDPEQQGHFYYYDLVDDDITWVAADGPDLWSVHGKNWYLGNDVILSLPGHDQPAYLVQIPEQGALPPPPEQTAAHSLSSGPVSNSLQELCDLAQDGDTLTVRSVDTEGEPLREIQGCGSTAANFTIQGGDPCPVVNINAVGSAISGKGAFVIKGSDTTLKDICIDGITVSDGNGSGARQEAPRLTLDNVRITNSQDGVLSGAGSVSLTILNSDFEHNGGYCVEVCGRAHPTYFSDPEGELHIADTTYRCAVDAGHLVKSRGLKTSILRSVLDEADCRASRTIDISECGVLIVDRSTLRKGPESDNHQVVGMCWESQTRPGLARFTDSTIILVDRERVVMFGFPSTADVTVETARNTVIGHCDDVFDRWFSEARGDQCFATRADSGLEFDADGLPR